MPDLGPLVEEFTLSELDGFSYDGGELGPLVEEWTLSSLQGKTGSAQTVAPNMRERWTLSPLQGVSHATATAQPANPLYYNGTTYDVIMTGKHVDLPDLILDPRTVQAQEGGVKIVEPVITLTPHGNTTQPLMVGLATADDFGAAAAILANTAQVMGMPFFAVTFKEGAAGVLMGACFDSSKSDFATVLKTTSAALSSFTEINHLLGKPRYLGHATAVGFFAATTFGFFVLNEAEDPPAWRNRNNGLSGPVVTALGAFADGSLIVVAIDPAQVKVIGDQPTLLHKTTDGGQHWSGARGDFPDDITIYDLYLASTSHWYAATSAGVYKTTNGGTTWLLANGDLVANGGNLHVLSVTGDAADRNVCVVGGRGFVARTTNNGSHWQVFTSADGLGAKPVRFRVHQFESVILAAYGEKPEGNQDGFIWRSEDDGETWQEAFPGAETTYVNAFAHPTGYSADLIAIATPKLLPDQEQEPWIPTPNGETVRVKRSSSVEITINADTTTLAAITARAANGPGTPPAKARLIVRQIKDYRMQKIYNRIASGELEKIESRRASLLGLADVKITARDTDVIAPYPTNKTARVISPDDVIDASTEEGLPVLSMLVDESFVPYTKISWQEAEYTVTGISYDLSSSGRLMSLDTRTRAISSPPRVPPTAAPPRAPLPTRTTSVPVHRPPRGSVIAFGTRMPTASAT